MHPGAVVRASTQGMTSFTQGWVKHTCPLIKPLIQGRYEKESFSSQFYVRTNSKSPRYNCCITHFSCWQMWFSNAVGKMVAPCGVAILHKAVLPSLPHLQRFFPWNVCDVPYQNPRGHKKGQQKESKMANRNGHLSKSGNLGREKSITRVREVLSNAVVGRVVSGGGGMHRDRCSVGMNPEIMIFYQPYICSVWQNWSEFKRLQAIR